MIIEIKGRVCSGKTTSIIKLLDASKYTVIHSLDGDLEHVYYNVTGRNIFDDYGDRIKYSVGNIVEFDENPWFGTVQDEFINDFIAGNDEVLVLDISIPATYLERLKYKFQSEMNNHKTLIITHQQRVQQHGFNME